MTKIQKQAGSRKVLLYSGTKEGLRYALIRGCWHRQAGDKLTRSCVLHVIGLGSLLSFHWLVLNKKLGQKTGKLAVIDQILTILGRLLQRFWVRILLSYLVWPLSIRKFSLSQNKLNKYALEVVSVASHEIRESLVYPIIL